MQKNESGQTGNPYMRPMGRNSLLSAPAPLAPVQPVQYTPNEPEDEAPVSAQPMIFQEAPAADVFCEETAELDSAAEMPVVDAAEEIVDETAEEVSPEVEEQPVEEPVSRLFVELPEEFQPEENDAEDAFQVILPMEELEQEPEAEEEAQAELPADEPVERMVELPEELPQEGEETEAAEEAAGELQPWPEPMDYAAAYAVSRMAQPDGAAAETEEPQVEETAEEPQAEPLPEDGEPAYDFDPAYYAAYWQQWQNAMEAHQEATCSACPLLNNQRGKVCYVPVVIPDGTEVDPQVVLTLRNAAAQPEEAAQPAEDALFPDVELPQDAPDDIDDGFDDEDEDFTGDDAMADEDMPTPQTVPVGTPEIVEMPKMKKSRKWPWILLALIVLLLGGVFTLSRTGYLQAVVDWLGLPENVVQWLKDITLL